MKKACLALIILLLAKFSAYSAEKMRIAVVDFEADGVSQSLARETSGAC